MHEMGIAAQVVEIAEASIPEEMENVKVERVNLNIGRLAAVVPDSLRFCFDIMIENTRLAGAELHIREIPVKALCKDCEHEWIIDAPVFTCPRCDSGTLEILSGRELDISSIEIAD
jgi:hydrogenase nickel incorporation protein HypA/HybF